MGADTATSSRGVQCFPLTARAQHEEDTTEYFAIVYPLAMAAQRVGLLLAYGKKWLYPPPQLIRNDELLLRSFLVVHDLSLYAFSDRL